MRTVLQRVSHASVGINGEIHGQIGPGMLCLFGISPDDNEHAIAWMV